MAEWAHSPDPTEPLHVALAWWWALMSRDVPDSRRLLERLTHSPPAFGGYQWAADMLESASIASRVLFAVDGPDAVAFVRFLPEVGETARAFASFFTPAAAFMTLVKYPDGTWRVWGLGNRMVSAREVRL